MAPRPKQIVQRLGDVGLARVLSDLLDAPALVRLANTCGLKYPGMRTQSQTRERLVKDLVKRARSQVAASKAVVRALEKQVSGPERAWSELSAEDRAGRLCDDEFLGSDGNLGLHLYLLSRGEADKGGPDARLARALLLRVAANGSAPTQDEAAPRDDSRLRKRAQSQDKKIKHLEGQLLKTKDREKDLKRDLIQRKGDLAECRMLTERLRHELDDARSAGSRAEKRAASAADRTVTDLVASVKQLAGKQVKLTRAVERSAKQATAPPVVDPTPVVAPVKDATVELAAALREHRSEVVEALKSQARRIDELRSDVAAELAAALSTKRPRARGKSQRVGVFIDVQNMYYSARKLKGKLDFDALLEAAVRDRRLIQTTAYVVESKETDQSHFINMLQQRAINVQRKPLLVRADGSSKGDWDMELALDILDAAPKLDVVVLVSGDGDFAPLVKRVKTIGPRVEVIAFPRNAAKALIEAADRFQPLDRKFMIYRRTVRPAEPNKKQPRDAPGDSPGSSDGTVASG